MHSRASRPSLLLLGPILLACSTGTVEGSTSAFSASLGEGNDVDDIDDESESGDATEESGESESGESETTTTGEDESTTDESESTTETDTTETGDPDPCPLICDGQVDGTPSSCDAPYVIGRSAAKSMNGFFFGGNTTGSMDGDHDVCGPVDNQDNWDYGRDHFFRIFLYEGDQIDVTMTGQFDKRVKVHDEADCVGNAKDCSDGVLSYTALKDDWFTIVADGQSAAFMDWGDYTLTVHLTLGGGDACNCL